MFESLSFCSTRPTGRPDLRGVLNIRRLSLSFVILAFLFSFNAFANNGVRSVNERIPDGTETNLLPPPVVVTAQTAVKTTPSTFTVPISVGDITGLGIDSFQFNILYDPNVIDPSGGNFGCSTVGTIAETANLTPTCNVFPAPGTLRVAVSGTNAMTGFGTVLNITFTTDAAAVPGNISPLTFAPGSVFFFQGANTVASTTVNGQVTLIAPIAVTAPTLSKSIPSTFDVPITIPTSVTAAGIIAFQFDILYDSAVIDPFGSNAGCTTVGTIAGTAGLTAVCNVSPVGTLRVSVSGVSPMTGSGTILIVKFATDAAAAPGNFSLLTFQNLFVFNASGILGNTQVNGRVNLVGPTAAAASLAGRVISSTGRPVSNARITLTDTNGNVQRAVSNQFGYYRFGNVSTGASYVLNAASKRFVFQPRVLSVTGDLNDADIVSEP